jgi:hypothetical protein
MQAVYVVIGLWLYDPARLRLVAGKNCPNHFSSK